MTHPMQPGPNTEVTQPVSVREVAPPPSLAGGRHSTPGSGFITHSAAAINAMQGAAGDDISLALHKAALFGESISESLRTAMEAAKEITKEHEHQAKHAKAGADHMAQAAKHAERVADRLRASGDLAATPSRTTLPHGMPAPAAPPTGQAPAGMDVTMPTRFDPNDDPEGQYLRGGWSAGRQFWQRGRGTSSQPVMMGAERLRNYLGAKSFGAPPLEPREDGTFWHTEENRPAGADEIAKFDRANRIRNNLTGALDNVAHGQGITSVLGGASKFLGYAGAAYTAVQTAGQIAVDQRAKNAQFQTIYGGSNADQFAQRAHGAAFRWSQFGTMSGQQANQLFMGVSQLGLQGDQRQDALDFATKNFRSRGLDIAQSLELMTTAIDHGVNNFSALSSSISQVSKSAQEGGRNVGQMVERYNQMFGQLASQIGGQAAVTVAGNLTSVSAALPRELGDVNLGGLASSPTMRIMAAQNGMSYSQLLGMSQQAGGADMLAHMQQRMFNQRVTQSMSPGVMQSIQQRIQQASRGGVLSAGEARGVGAWALENGLNADQAMAMAQSLGIQGVNPGNVGTYVAEAIASGGLGISTQADQHDAVRRRLAGADTSRIGGQAIHRGSDIKASSREGVVGRQEVALAGDLGVNAKTYASHWKDAGTASHDMHFYARDYVEKTGRRSKVLEDLMAGGNYDPSRRFTVKTKSGLRDVDMHTAIEHYSDQLMQGDVEISAGKGAGQTVGEFTGLADPNRRVTSDRKGGVHGDKVQGGKDGSVKIEASAELMRMFNFSATGGAYIDQARASGIPATALPPASQLPTGG